MEIEWISKDKYCEESGFSAGRVRGWITRHWERGVQYQIHGKTTAISIVEVDKWWGKGGPESPAVAESPPIPTTRRRSQTGPISRLVSPARYR